MSETNIKEVSVSHQGNEYVILEYEEEQTQMQNKMNPKSCESSCDMLENSDESCLTPVVLRNHRNKKVARSKKCISVVVEPSSYSWKSDCAPNSSRRSMYELGNHGWILDKLKENGSAKNNLNIDQDIKNILNVNSSVDVTLGSIKLTF